ncbi:hypothetical protein EYZ11_011707 [Aspergillus tanneri]|uniref:Mediator of RNA polymerase II transcription subunit 7 n=1 Tax=Aspergillus tanneri TaxID=1220188 RepID=A0A4S3J492_9EURO|nr:hypothetical protein EYZ11_011707 [Aspergillus tanneri]
MAETGQQRALTTAFPPPPPLWKHFTTVNIKKLEEIKRDATKGEDGKPQKKKTWTPTELRSLDLPTELRFLVPPEIPISGQYNVFGELQNLSTNLPSLKDQGITQLYPEPQSGANGEPTKSLLLNFLEFVGILSINPEQFEPKVEDLRNLFINAHHLLNLYRPHQARESLILMMEEQLNRTREEIQQMDKLKDEISGVLEQLEKEGADVHTAIETTDEHDKRAAIPEQDAIENSTLVWKLLDENN